MGVHFKENEEKVTLWMIIVGVAIIGILIASLIIYLLNVNSLNEKNEIAKGNQELGEIQEKDDEKFESVSIDIGKSVNEVANEKNTSTENNSASNNSTKNTTGNTSKNTNTSKETKNNNEKSNTTSNMTSNNVETNSNVSNENNEKNKEEIKFNAPINGEILREFASDSLVYSNTLEEWIVHNGVDIKADKTAVVKAAAKGKVYAIKNDPRYGLTVIVNHENGYQTVYANLLTAEFVVEGEDVEVGQTIGTVGNSANFEVGDEYHLHFEILKDSQYLNPTNYMNF